MSYYFGYFPVINYKDKNVRDITRRNIIVEKHLNNPYMFLPLTLNEKERPEDIAYKYYGSVDYTWLVLMSNRIIDPYTEWYLSDEEWIAFMMKKYQKQSNAHGYDIIAWTQNTMIDDNIVFYYDEENDIQINQMTYENMDDNSGFRPVRIYEYEYTVNQNKKEILLVDKNYLKQIETEFRKLMK